jgi:hypothetical protein
MRFMQIRVPVVAAIGIASLLVAFCAIGPAAASPDRHAQRRHAAMTPHYGYGGPAGPLYGYYTRHGQYVPGAGDRLIQGPGYVYVPGHGILDEACNLPSSTCTNEYRDVR